MPISPSDVSVVIPTRGDVDLTPIIDSLAGVAEIIVWDNSQREDLKVWARYAALDEASMDVVYTQDDDCLVDIEKVCAAYEPGVLTANMPVSRWSDYPDSALVGWGAVFDRHLPVVAQTLFAEHLGFMESFEWFQQNRDWYYRTCDVVFSALLPVQKIDVGFRHLPWAESAGRMFKTPGHKDERDAMLALARSARQRERGRNT